MKYRWIDRHIRRLERAAAELTRLALTTPTGEERNDLTSANILLLAHIENIKAIARGEDPFKGKV